MQLFKSIIKFKLFSIENNKSVNNTIQRKNNDKNEIDLAHTDNL